jgi:glycosyltransferase involved in cell wall biosynthesis
MKAAFFDFTIAYGGAPAGTISLARRLSECMEVHVIDAYGLCADYRERVVRAGLPYHVLHPKAKNLFIGNAGRPVRRFISFASQIADLWQIRKQLVIELRNIDPDVVWINNEKSLVFVLGPLLRTRYPIVLYYRGWGTANQIGTFFRFLLKKRTDGIIVHSPLIAARIASYRIPQGKIFAIPNAVGLESSVDEIRNRNIDIPCTDRKLKILLPAARLVHEKGQDVAIRALKRLRDRGQEAILWITGSLPTGVGQGFYEGIRADVARLGLEQDVFFLGWRDDLQAIIAHSDLMIVPSRTEGLPRVIVEAMLLGVPVCASPVGGIPEAIIDGKTGFLVEIGDDKMLAERILSLAADSELKADMLRSAKVLALKMFSLDGQTKAVMAVFNSVAGHVEC